MWSRASKNVEQFLLSGLATGAIYALVAVGFVVIYNVTGIINFAQGEFAMCGAMTAAALVAAAVPLPLALLAGVALSALVGLVAWYAALRGAANSSIVVQIIITIGLSIALRGVALLVFGSSPKSLPAFGHGSALLLGAATLAPQQLWVFGIVIVLMGLLWLLFERTRLGSALLAAAMDRPAARLMGIDPLAMGAFAFVLSATLAGIAGVAIAPITLATYNMGLALGLKGFVAAILGGISSIPGAVIGGLLLGVVESVGSGLLPSGSKDAIAFVVLIAVLFARPEGILGHRAQRV
ncbi:branched-chain amino acid ABC transporter permease [bacterium]|nr:MAG: branched-chain amino acid ABC transporter permease [bacterium]